MKIFKGTVFSGVPPEYMAQPAEQCADCRAKRTSVPYSADSLRHN